MSTTKPAAKPVAKTVTALAAVAAPFHSEAMRLHVFVIALPFVTMLAWALFGREYHPAAILLLSLLFYFFPRKSAFANPKTSAMS